eukprot:389862-Prymnesium_polylepis.1
MDDGARAKWCQFLLRRRHQENPRLEQADVGKRPQGSRLQVDLDRPPSRTTSRPLERSLLA